MDAASKSLARRRVAAENMRRCARRPSIEALPLSGRTSPNVRSGSNATGSSQRQVRPRPICPESGSGGCVEWSGFARVRVWTHWHAAKCGWMRAYEGQIVVRHCHFRVATRRHGLILLKNRSIKLRARYDADDPKAGIGQKLKLPRDQYRR